MKKSRKEQAIEILKCFYECVARRNDADFRKFVTTGYNNPNVLEICNYGNSCRGNIVYDIEAFGHSVGFFAEFLYVLIRLYFSDERGFVPYVNWGQDFLYHEDVPIRGEENAFLHYFNQVSDIKNIEDAAYVVHSTKAQIAGVQTGLNTVGYAVSEEYINALSRIIKKYISYNEETLSYLKKNYDDLLDGKRTLAVHFRGSDFRRQYNNHPIFVSIEQGIEQVERILQKKDYEYIFLATDEQGAIDIYKKKFGDKVKYFEDVCRVAEGDESVAYSYSKRENHHYLLGLEVIRDQYMLTRCEGLVGGISNLTLTAQMMKKAWYENGYDDLVIINSGLNSNDNRFSDAKH